MAIKILEPQLSADPEGVARFLQERSILMGLDHPNIVRLRDLVAEVTPSPWSWISSRVATSGAS